MHGFIPFVFWMWLASCLINAAAAWKAFGFTRLSWIKQNVSASVACVLLMNAAWVATIVMFGLAGWVPGGMDVSHVLTVIAMSVVPAILVPQAVANLGGDPIFWAFIFGMMAWFALREAFTDGVPIQPYLYFVVIISAVLVVLAGVGTWRLLTGRRTRWAGAYRAPHTVGGC